MFFFNQALSDPVLEIRRQRAIILNIPENQLPILNIPLGIPPPLPPIQTNKKDLKKHGKKNHKHYK